MATESLSPNFKNQGAQNYGYEEEDSGTCNPDSDNDDQALIKQEKPAASVTPRPISASSSKMQSQKSSDTLTRRTSSHVYGPSVACPTCSGKGKLSQAQSDTMLALIPVHDQRLKPKRTKLKLAIVFILLVITGGLCFAFLYPKKVAISVLSVSAQSIRNLTSGNIKINMEVLAGLSNANFFTVGIVNTTVQVLFVDTKDQSPHEVGNTIIKETISLAMRKTLKKTFPVSTTYTDMDAKIVRKVCVHYRLYFLILVQLTASVKYWLHSEQISTSKFYYIDCSNATTSVNKPRNNARSWLIPH